MINFIKILAASGRTANVPPITGNIPISNLGRVGNSLNSRQRNLTMEYNGTFFSTGIHLNGDPDRQKGLIVHGSEGNYVLNDSVTPPRSIPENFLHSQVSAQIFNNKLYIFQTNPHNGIVEVFENDNGVDFGGTFTLITTIPGDFAYISAMKTISGLAIFLRGGGGDYDSYILTNNNIELTSWTSTRVAIRSYLNTRHYPLPLSNWYDGTYYWCSILRRSNDGSGSPAATENALFLLKTQDFETFQNQDGTFSKDVTIGNITDDELDANFLIDGDESNPNIFIGTLYGHRRDDKFYFNCVDWQDNDLAKVLYYNGTTWSKQFLNIPNLEIDRNGRNIGAYAQIIHKGSYLYYMVRTTVNSQLNVELWRTDFNFQNLTFIRSFGEVVTSYLPENLWEITNNRITVFGNNSDTPASQANYSEFNL